MSVERTIANFLLIAHEDLKGARLLAGAGNRNAAYLAQQAAEKVIRAVLTSEDTHAGVRHDLREMVAMVPDPNPTKALLRATVHLAAYATAYRYPGTARIPQSPSIEAIEDQPSNVQRALDAVSTGLGVDLSKLDAVATDPSRCGSQTRVRRRTAGSMGNTFRPACFSNRSRQSWNIDA